MRGGKKSKLKSGVFQDTLVGFTGHMDIGHGYLTFLSVMFVVLTGESCPILTIVWLAVYLFVLSKLPNSVERDGFRRKKINIRKL